MKKNLFIALLAFGMAAKAQITLEHSYANASNYSTDLDQLMIVNFVVSGEKYVRINREGKTIDIYNLNHSLLKSISYAGFPQQPNDQATFLYFSQNLFTTDTKIDFMYVYSTSASVENTQIYNEDGELLFQADSMAALVTVNSPQEQLPIYNTTNGTKMILSCQFNDTARVYSLPGTLSAGIEEANNQLIQAQCGRLSNLFPNPSNGAVTLQYQLPEGVQEGELILYNMQGAEVKRYKVDNTFKDVLIDNKQLQAGTYFYQLQTNKGAVGTKKMVVIK